MLPIQAQWDALKIKQFNGDSQEALLSDEQTLFAFSQDFGKLTQSQPSAVYFPKAVQDVQSLIRYANKNKLSIAIRGNGLSQCGQSLPVSGGVTMCMQELNKPLEWTKGNVWVEANCSWADLLALTLSHHQAPYILPYNCNLSVAGVLSAGGVGASSFKYGTINAHVSALEVVDGTGELYVVDKTSELFHACLSGQGRCGVITKAKIELRPVQPKVITYCLVYTDQKQWFADIEQLSQQADYLELFCSPSIQGAQLKGNKRVPMAQWLYGLHCSFEFEGESPDWGLISKTIKPWNVIHQQVESIQSYLLRHNSRFEVMKMLGQWDLFHPWYECFIPTVVLKDHLSQLLADLPLHYASLVHIAPVAPQHAEFLMFPKGEPVSSFMILNPGVPAALKDSCLQAIQMLDERLLQKGGKRYLSGFLGGSLDEQYWVNHFEQQYAAWQSLKKRFDPHVVFRSMLYPS